MLRKIFSGLLVIAICFIYFYPLNKMSAEANGNEIDISTSPQKVFLEINNGKPGDTYTKVLTVKNNGSKSFHYLFSNRFLTGSQKLYNELILKVTDKTGVLYSGKLKDFKGLDPRFLSNTASEDLTLSVTMPYDLGNSYQGLNTKFQFKFYVEGTMAGLLPANGPTLPNTATSMFNLAAAGLVLLMAGVFMQMAVKYKSKINKQI